MKSNSEQQEQGTEELTIDKMIDEFNKNLTSPIPLGSIISSRIKNAMDEYICRKRLNLKQEDLAKAIQYNKGSVSKWLSGENLPNADALFYLSKFLEVPSDYLLGLDDNYTSTSFDYSEVQKQTGLSELSIKNLVKYKNSQNESYTMDSLFRNYNIEYTHKIRNETHKITVSKIYNYDYSSCIPDVSVQCLDAPEYLKIKLEDNGFSTISCLLSYRDIDIKNKFDFSNEEMDNLIDSVRRFLDEMFHEKGALPETGRAFIEIFKNNYADKLYFLNSIIEDGHTFLDFEKNIYKLSNLNNELKFVNKTIDYFATERQKIKDKYPDSKFENYTDEDMNNYGEATNLIASFKLDQHRIKGEIEITKAELHNQFISAIERYIENYIK